MYHSCYRLYAAVDVTLAIFILIIWWIFFYRAGELIGLQFEKHDKNDSMIDRIDSYRSNLRSIGSGNSNETSAETLREIYNKVQDNCKAYNEAAKTDPKMKDDLHFILFICFSLIGMALGMFMFFGLMMIFTTRKGKASDRRVILAMWILQILFSLQYIAAAMELCLDPRFCAPKIHLSPMKIVVTGFTFIYKPYFLYIVYKYYQDVVTKEYVDELLSSSTSSDSVSTDESYEFDKGLGITSETNLKTAENADHNENFPAGINRQVNFTDITKEHGVCKRVPNNERRFLGMGWKDGKGLNKVNPEFP